MKESKKQIEANLRNKLTKEYKRVVDNLRERLKNANYEIKRTNDELSEAKSQIEDLKDQIEQYKDWVYRLEMYLDLDEEKKKDFISEIRTKRKMNTYLNQHPILKNSEFAFMFDSFLI